MPPAGTSFFSATRTQDEISVVCEEITSWFMPQHLNVPLTFCAPPDTPCMRPKAPHRHVVEGSLMSATHCWARR